MSIEIVMGAP